VTEPDPEPIEVLLSWNTEQEMMRDLRGFVLESTGRLMGMFEPGGAKTTEYLLMLRDGRGEPLRFPIKVVSRTTFPQP